MKLTIGILVSDKDRKYLPTLLAHIEERVKPAHEVIVCNNSSQEINLENTIVLNNGNGNIYQLRGRKLIIEKAQGKYIWFVDGDDDVKYVEEDLELKNDIIEFDYDFITKTGVISVDFFTEEKVFTSDNFFADKITLRNKTLWNCFIKTSILKELIKEIPDENISTGEDWIYSFGAMKYAKTYERSGKKYYYFNEKDSSSVCKDFSDCFENFERIFFGLDKTIPLLYKITDNKIDDLLDRPLIEFFANYYLEKIKTTLNLEVGLKMLDLIRTIIPEETLIKISKEILSGTVDIEEFNRFVSVVTQRFEVKHTVTRFGVAKEVNISYTDFNKETDNLYEDTDIEGNPFTLNCDTAELKICTKKSNNLFWTEIGQKWEFHDNSVKDDKYIIHFSFGNACNLHCSYCFANKENTHELCLDEQKAIIDKVFEIYDGKIEHIVLNNSGEPLYNSEKFWEMYDYIISKGLSEYKIIFNTNAVDYSDYDIKRCSYRGDLLVSIDGPKEIQDAHRGEGTYDSITKTIQALKEANCNLYATTVFMDDEMPIFDILEHLYSIGFRSRIYYSPVRIDGYWTEDRKQRLYKRYEDFYKELEKRICKRKEFHWFATLNLQMDKIEWGTFFKNCPRYDYNFIDVDAKGDIFACYEEVGSDDRVIGNIFTSDLEELKNKRIQKLEEISTISKSCIEEKCPFINFCGGKNNFCKHTDADMFCQIEKIKYKYLLKIYAYISNYYLENERLFIFDDFDQRMGQIDKNPQLLSLDKEFAKTWFFSRNIQKIFRKGYLNADDFVKFLR